MIQGLNHITLAVADLETSLTFYRDILGCQPLARRQRGTYLRAGDLWRCLSLEATGPRSPQTDYPHFALTVHPPDFDDWRDRNCLFNGLRRRRFADRTT
jgi:catechol 2,3-dioxygenase-like lactoylglutathione lyase family enzyme